MGAQRYSVRTACSVRILILADPDVLLTTQTVRGLFLQDDSESDDGVLPVDTFYSPAGGLSADLIPHRL